MARQVAWQEAPRAARSHHIEDPVDDLAHRPCARPARAIRRRQMGHDHEPFLIRHIGLVSARLANMLLAGGWGPHGGSGVGLSNPLESHSTPATQPLSKRPLRQNSLTVVNTSASAEKYRRRPVLKPRPGSLPRPQTGFGLESASCPAGKSR